MEPLAIFGLQLFLSLVVYTLIAKWHIAPWLASKPIRDALPPLLFPHAIRHLGLTFFVPGVVAEPLPTYFSYSVGFGDLISGLLAIVSLVALRRGWGMALPMVWVFNVVGTADLLNALHNPASVPLLGATWFIPTFWVPVLLVTHGMIFAQLVKKARRPSSLPDKTVVATG